MYTREETLPVHRLDTDYITKTANAMIGERTPRVEPIDDEFVRLGNELYQLTFRVNDSERVEKDLHDFVVEAERLLKAKKAVVDRHSASTERAVLEMVERVEREIVIISDELKVRKDRHQRQIRIVGAAKQRLKEFPHDRYNELKQTMSELKKSDGKLREFRGGTPHVQSTRF